MKKLTFTLLALLALNVTFAQGKKKKAAATNVATEVATPGTTLDLNGKTKEVTTLKPTMPVNPTTAATPTSQPQAQKDISKFLDFKNAEYDFGKIPQGTPTKYIVTVKNISKDSVMLDRVQVSCGCTTPKYTAGKIAPGQSTEVELGYNAGSMGSFTKYVTFFFDNSSMQKQVSFKGETYAVTAEPAPVNNATEKLKQAE